MRELTDRLSRLIKSLGVKGLPEEASFVQGDRINAACVLILIG